MIKKNLFVLYTIQQSEMFLVRFSILLGNQGHALKPNSGILLMLKHLISFLEPYLLNHIRLSHKKLHMLNGGIFRAANK